MANCEVFYCHHGNHSDNNIYCDQFVYLHFNINKSNSILIDWRIGVERHSW